MHSNGGGVADGSGSGDGTVDGVLSPLEGSIDGLSSRIRVSSGLECAHDTQGNRELSCQGLIRRISGILDSNDSTSNARTCRGDYRAIVGVRVQDYSTTDDRVVSAQCELRKVLLLVNHSCDGSPVSKISISEGSNLSASVVVSMGVPVGS